MSPQTDARPPVVVVTGPTAAGKTSLAIELAQRFDGEIVNADSMQVYRGMDIGTAKATADQQRRVPHHLIDVVAPDARFSAGRYGQMAREAAARIHARERLVVLTGGTGLYIRAFLEGLIEAEADPELRERLEREHAEACASGDPHALHRRLAELDPEEADRIHPNDARRVVRALEIQAQSGAEASRVRAAHGFRERPYRTLHLALDLERQALNARIDARCAGMIEQGLLQEVRGLIEQGYGPELRPMQSIGYRHVVPVAAGSTTLEMALESMQRDTRRFARRQRTWLRAVPEVEWLPADDAPRLVKRVEQFLETP